MGREEESEILRNGESDAVGEAGFVEQIGACDAVHPDDMTVRRV
jgi:hypothetical protein